MNTLAKLTRPTPDLRIVTLPAGMDPDEVIRRDPREWEFILATAENNIDYNIRMRTQGRDIHNAKVKAEIAAEILPLIDELE